MPTFRILALQEATLYAKVAGYLKTLTVDKGDTVKAGQFLADIEVPELFADQAKYKAEPEVADTNYERTGEAAKKAPDLVVPQTVDDMRSSGKWRGPISNEQKRCSSFRKITAPFSGIITADL